MNQITEQEFLLLTNQTIEYIGIYELDVIIDDNQLDSEGIIVAFEDGKILVKSQAVGEDDYEFSYFSFENTYDCRKIISSPNEPIRYIFKEDEENSYRVLRFVIGERPILVTACEDFITIGISHWGLNDEWLEFENNNLLNDK